MYDEAVLAMFKQRLLEMRGDLLSLDDSGVGPAAVELDQSRIGRLSRMDALQDQAMSVEARRRRRASLRGIDEALQRMGKGEYGSCVHCGEPVAYGRLELDPAIESCVHCAAEMEQGSR